MYPPLMQRQLLPKKKTKTKTKLVSQLVLQVEVTTIIQFDNDNIYVVK